jgi:hypothetical protein
MRNSGNELFFVSRRLQCVFVFFFVTGSTVSFSFLVTGELFFVSDASNGFWNIHHAAVHSGDACGKFP